MIDRQHLGDALFKQAQSALVELVAWRTGQLTFKALPEEAVKRDADMLMEARVLLLEAMREIDERRK
jgi:hypothetical protein